MFGDILNRINMACGSISIEHKKKQEAMRQQQDRKQKNEIAGDNIKSREKAKPMGAFQTNGAFFEAIPSEMRYYCQ